MQSQPRFNTAERVLLLIPAILADGLEFLAAMGATIPVVGQALEGVSLIGGVITSAIIMFCIIIKGGSIRWFLAGSGIDLIPILNGLPAKTAALIATFIQDKAETIVPAPIIKKIKP